MLYRRSLTATSARTLVEAINEKKGYPRQATYKDGRPHPFRVERLVAPEPDGAGFAVRVDPVREVDSDGVVVPDKSLVIRTAVAAAVKWTAVSVEPVVVVAKDLIR